MQSDNFSLMRGLAPDLCEEIERRALFLEKVASFQPVGRRQLAQKMSLPEREIRNMAAVLRDLGYLSYNSSGMTLSSSAEEIIDSVREFVKALNGLNALEKQLESRLPVNRILIVSGNADHDPMVLKEAGRICAVRLRTILQNGNTLAVTGGRSIAAVVRQLQYAAPLNVMVVPARGGLGHSVELQANTLAEELAGRLGGHYRLIHLPDHLDSKAMQELMKIPDVSETMEFLQRADIILHGIGKASDMMDERRLSRHLRAMLTEKKAKGECFGAYFDIQGQCLLESSGIGFDLARLKPTCKMIAVAAGAEKAEAILSVLRHRHHELLVTDEAAAMRILSLLNA